METLKLSPDELFKLIESSKGYSGEDYNRWLASEIINIAERDGVQFSQLLVKKFNIINEILEEVSEKSEICDEYMEIFHKLLKGNAEEEHFYGFEVTEEDPMKIWYEGVDYDKENSFFVKENCPRAIREKVENDEPLTLAFRLRLDSPDKKSLLFNDAKSSGVGITTNGALMLYRLCNMVNAYELTNLRVGILVPAKFLYDEENTEIIRRLLCYFTVKDGICIKSIELDKSAFNSGEFAFLVLDTITMENEVMDFIELDKVELSSDGEDGFNRLERYRYSRSSFDMDILLGSLDEDKEDSDIGYLSCNGFKLNMSPNSDEYIPITDKNLLDVVALYGVAASRRFISLGERFNCLVDGKTGYNELLYNCLPLFLYDVDSRISGLSREMIDTLVEKGTPYFSFEAKELFNLCSSLCSEVSLEFHKYRRENADSEFNNKYLAKLENLKKFVGLMSEGYI